MVEWRHNCTYNVVVYMLTNVLMFVANPATLDFLCGGGGGSGL